MIQDDDGQFAPGEAVQLTIPSNAFQMLHLVSGYNGRLPYREVEHQIALAYLALLEAEPGVDQSHKEEAEDIVERAEI